MSRSPDMDQMGEKYNLLAWARRTHPTISSHQLNSSGKRGVTITLNIAERSEGSLVFSLWTIDPITENRITLFKGKPTTKTTTYYYGTRAHEKDCEACAGILPYRWGITVTPEFTGEWIYEVTYEYKEE